MENRDDQNPQEGGQPPRRGGNLLLLAIVIGVLAVMLLVRTGSRSETVDYHFFLEQIKANNVEYVIMGETTAEGFFKTAPTAPTRYDSEGKPIPPAKDPKTGLAKKLPRKFTTTVNRPGARDELEALLTAHNVPRRNREPDNSLLLFYVILLLIPVGLILFFWLSYRRTQSQLMGGGFLSSFSKSPAKRYEPTHQHITFKDVAGIETVKADVQEIVEYLKDPQKFQRLGGRVPQGVLLNGAPGTGKTLLARAIAGEAGVPYYSVNGSEFIQMFVGVGASRVRDLFKQAKDTAPSIIFIDEIDAVGRQRGAGLGGGHDEREQTLNQILSEMDGFEPSDSVIVVAATNRPDVLDPALLRPGRFDRHITVDRPTRKGRVEIFKVHVRRVPLSEDVDLESLAGATTGLTGADIRNIVNEAALWAARQGKSIVEMEDFEYAHDKVLMGAKRDEVFDKEEKEKTAYHEAGHTITAWRLEGAKQVRKVTIIPRGRALGVTWMMDTQERTGMSRREALDSLVMSLGGRAAELIMYQELTTGATQDLEQSTFLARRMVTHWGMSDAIGPVSYKLSDADPFLGKEIHAQRQFSEHTMQLIDNEVARILHDAAERAEKLLMENRDALEKVARALLEKEELDEHELTALLGPSAQAKQRASKAPAEEPQLSTGNGSESASEAEPSAPEPEPPAGGQVAGGESPA